MFPIELSNDCLKFSYNSLRARTTWLFNIGIFSRNAAAPHGDFTVVCHHIPVFAAFGGFVYRFRGGHARSFDGKEPVCHRGFFAGIRERGFLKGHPESSGTHQVR